MAMIRLQLCGNYSKQSTTTKVEAHFKRFSNSRANKSRINMFMHISCQVIWYGFVVRCVLYVWLAAAAANWKKCTSYGRNIEKKKRNLVALLLLAELLTICYYENQNIDCAINTRPFTSFQLHESAFRCANARTPEQERQTHALAHTHMTISKFANTLTVKACSYYLLVTKIWCTVSQCNGIEVKAS